jgi:hypothetical protein
MEWIVDEGRQGHTPSVWENASGYIETVKHSYRRDNWQNQPSYCEVWSEKGTVRGSILPVTDELGVTVRVCHGYGSTGMEGEIGELFATIEKPITVFYLGDHDPSGHDIERDIHARVQRSAGKDFEMVRLAIHASDIKAFKLPPQKIKATDSRARGFQRQFGKKAATVELDALPVSELRRRIRSAIEDLIEPTAWARQVRVQQMELECIAEVAERFKTLPQLDEDPNT